MSQTAPPQAADQPAYATEQERFWAGDFGNDYIDRNCSEDMVAANARLFAAILKSVPEVGSIAELGCNIGLNLQALHRLKPQLELRGYEINAHAAAQASAAKVAEIVCTTILDPLPAEKKFDLAFTKGVLIHINPEALGKVYSNLFELSRRYVLVCEYYNPTPVMVQYRGNADRLYKRDFAGEMMDRHGLRLLDYGFVYHRDSRYAQDDLTWFLLEK